MDIQTKKVYGALNIAIFKAFIAQYFTDFDLV